MVSRFFASLLAVIKYDASNHRGTRSGSIIDPAPAHLVTETASNHASNEKSLVKPNSLVHSIRGGVTHSRSTMCQRVLLGHRHGWQSSSSEILLRPTTSP